MHAWLDGAPDRIAVIHCKAGKGRSGTVACSYLLTLTGTPNSPLTAATAAGRMHQVVDQIPAAFGDQETVGGEHRSQTSLEPQSNRPHFFQGGSGLGGKLGAAAAPVEPDTKPLYDEAGPPTMIVASPTTLSLESESAATSAGRPVPLSGANPERSFTDALKGVLDLHTSKRMKPSSSVPPPSPSQSGSGSKDSGTEGASASGDGKVQKKQKQGVSIPSQRRWLYYWALILGGEEPRDIFKNPNVPDSEPKPLVRITSITVQMRELKGVKISIVRAANAVLDKAVEYKNKRKSKPASEEESPSSSSSSLKKKKSTSFASPSPKDTADGSASFARGSNKLWASIGRYDDDLVEFLEDWEAKTRGMGSSSPNHTPAPGQQEGNSSIADLDGELKMLFDEHGKWDKEKMVRSFAKFGVVETAKVEGKSVKKEDGEESSVVAYTLKLVSDKRVLAKSSEEEPGKSGGGPASEDDAPEINVVSEEPTDLQAARAGMEDVVEDDGESAYSGTTAASRLTTVDGHDHPAVVKDFEQQGLVVEAFREVRIKLYVGQVFIGWMWFVPTFHMPQPPPSSPISRGDANHTATFHLTRKDLDFPLGLGTAIVDVDIDMEWVSPSGSGDNVRAAKITSASSNSIASGGGIGTKVGQAFAGGLGTDGESGVVRKAVEVGQATGI
ncbi:hypothetical protein MD484_g7444, partial [Candolleomyces efflorescens]